MRYTLNEVWTPIRATIQQEIMINYGATTDSTITLQEAQKIESLLYNFTHTLRKCYMLFSDEAQLVDLQNLLKETISHKVYALVTDWKLICATLNVDSAYFISQDSYYDVTDTPHIEHKEFNNLEAKVKQVEALFNHSQAIKECYNEIKLLVQTIY